MFFECNAVPGAAPRAGALMHHARVFAYGTLMMIGTQGVLYHRMQTGLQDLALTMAFTTFVLFQLFNVFNARNENGSAFNAQFFSNHMLWLSLGAALLLQMLATHWGPATRLFGTTGVAWADWGVAAGVAAFSCRTKSAHHVLHRTERRAERWECGESISQKWPAY